MDAAESAYREKIPLSFDELVDTRVYRPLHAEGFERYQRIGVGKISEDGVMKWLAVRHRRGRVTLCSGIWPLYIPPSDRIAGPSRTDYSLGPDRPDWSCASLHEGERAASEIQELLEGEIIPWFAQLRTTSHLVDLWKEPVSRVQQSYIHPWDDYDAGFLHLRLGQYDFAQAYLQSAAESFAAIDEEWAQKTKSACDEALEVASRGAREVQAWLSQRQRSTCAYWELNKHLRRTYRLRHANPFELKPRLDQVLKDSQSRMRASAKYPGQRKPEFLLEVEAPASELPKMDALVEFYDRPGFSSDTRLIKFAWRLQHRRADEIAQILRRTVLSEEGKALADSATNILYVQDFPGDFLTILRQIRLFDTPVPQVEIEVELIELFENDPTKLRELWEEWQRTQPAPRRLPPSAYEGLSRADTASLHDFLRYLESKDQAARRLTTKLSIPSGATSILESSVSPGGFEANVSGAADTQERRRLEDNFRRREGLLLRFTPAVTGATTRLVADILLRTPSGYNALSQPTFSDQRLRGDLTTEQGKRYLIGSLRRRLDENSGLGDRPLERLRSLLKRRSAQYIWTELFIFVSPSWSTPYRRVSPMQQKYRPDDPEVLERLAKENPNLEIEAEDRALLQRYLKTMRLSE